MTERRYLPEGCRIGTAENSFYTATLGGLERAMVQGRILEGIATVCDCTRMELQVDLGCATGILAREEVLYSHDGAAPKDIAILTRVGKPVCFRVMRIEREEGRPRAILSRRAVQAECMAESVLRLRAGDVLPARVTHLEPFGAFIDIGCGIVSLLTVDAISVSRIAHPSERFRVGESIAAVVRQIDPISGRVYMTHRELLGTWEENAADFSPTQTVTGIVRSIEPYGIFVELTPNLAGLAELREGVTGGDRCAVYIKSILPERMKIKLVLIDACADRTPMRLRYFIRPESTPHIDYWRYSPAGCDKCIETRFE